MKITMIGTGYVGLVSGTCFADLGNDVICLDIDKEKIARLNKGEVPIYEPGLEEKLRRSVREGRLQFTTDYDLAVNGSDIIFICVGTPSRRDGSVNTDFVFSAVREVARRMNGPKIIVDKSTVPVGTADRVKQVVSEELSKRGVSFSFSVVSNPEFLREGAAVNDFFNPDRIIVGTDDDDAWRVMERLYKSLARTNRPIVRTDPRSAEMIKYASNAMLATRISFVNQLSSFCEVVGADITAVSKGMGLDTRIGPRFLHAGTGYGGSCFPKDVKGLINSIKGVGCDASILEAVHEANEFQKRITVRKLKEEFKSGLLKGRSWSSIRVAVWGLSFKPKTDDVREAPSLVVVKELSKLGVKLSLFDPEGADNFRKAMKESGIKGLSFAKNPYDAIKGADALILLTEWDEFRNPDFEKIKALMKSPVIIDGRNIYLAYRDLFAEKGFSYRPVGIKPLRGASD